MGRFLFQPLTAVSVFFCLVVFIVVLDQWTGSIIPNDSSYYVDAVKNKLKYFSTTCETKGIIYSMPIRNFSLPMRNIKDFFYYILNPSVICQQAKSFGGAHTTYSKMHYRDGDKSVCLDKIYGIKKENCIVYSFGISHEWSFDDEFDQFGCKIYAFDPSMKVKKHRRGKNILFYPVGIGGSDRFDPRFNNEIKKMSSIFKLLNHENDDILIDYLKMDVEGAEIEFFNDVLANNGTLIQKFKQIGLEIHPGPYTGNIKTYSNLYDIFMKLEERGFRLIFSAPNPVPANFYFLDELKRTVNGYYELVWVNVKP